MLDLKVIRSEPGAGGGEPRAPRRRRPRGRGARAGRARRASCARGWRRPVRSARGISKARGRGAPRRTRQRGRGGRGARAWARSSRAPRRSCARSRPSATACCSSLPNLAEDAAPDGGEDDARGAAPGGRAAGLRLRRRATTWRSATLLGVIDLERGARKVSGARFAYLLGPLVRAAARPGRARHGPPRRPRASRRWSRRCWCARRRCGGPASSPPTGRRSTGPPRTTCSWWAPPRCRWRPAQRRDPRREATCRCATPASRPASAARPGAAGKDTRGIFRVHQFDKVEMFSFVPARGLAPTSTSASWPSRRRSSRRSSCRTGWSTSPSATSARSAARKFDCEAWMPGQGAYREVTSAPTAPTTRPAACGCRVRRARGHRAAAHPQRHRRGRRPHDRRHPREPPARGRLGGDAGGAPGPRGARGDRARDEPAPRRGWR